jgi:proteasome assembly chaperone (PAC2) family protein
VPQARRDQPATERRAGQWASGENNRRRPSRARINHDVERAFIAESTATVRHMPDSPSSTGRDLRDLVDPVVVMAFGGWNDAGNAATGAIEHLAEAYQAQPVYALDPDDFYDFQVNRPRVSLTQDDDREITWPTTELKIAELPDGRDVILVQGLEPNLRWRQFSTLIASALSSANVTRVHLLGALLADTPHTRPIPVSVSTGNRELMKKLGLAPSTYEGPTGIIGVLGDTLGRAGVEVLTLWSAIPHYVSHPPCPKATLALLSHLERVLNTSFDLGELTELARAWERGVNELAAEDTEVAEYVASLEQMQDATELPEATGDAIAAEFERYLRRRQG